MKKINQSLSARIITTVLLVTALSNIFISFVVKNQSSKALQDMMYLDLQHNISVLAPGEIFTTP